MSRDLMERKSKRLADLVRSRLRARDRLLLRLESYRRVPAKNPWAEAYVLDRLGDLTDDLEEIRELVRR